MLKALILENFKAFGGRRVIPIRPITLIFGPNSAGKSAILQSLLLLKQTAFPVEEVDSLLVPRGRYVDLGAFDSFVFRSPLATEIAVPRTLEITPLIDFPGSYRPIAIAADTPVAINPDGESFVVGMGARIH